MAYPVRGAASRAAPGPAAAPSRPAVRASEVEAPSDAPVILPVGLTGTPEPSVTEDVDDAGQASEEPSPREAQGGRVAVAPLGRHLEGVAVRMTAVTPEEPPPEPPVAVRTRGPSGDAVLPPTSEGVA